MSDEVRIPVEFAIGQTVVAPYVNLYGEAEVRRFVPRKYYVAATAYHPEPTLFLKAWDLDRASDRIFLVDGFVAGAKVEGVGV